MSNVENEGHYVEGNLIDPTPGEKAVVRHTQHGGEEWIPSQRALEPWMCQAPRSTDGQPCRRAAVAGGVCLKHGAQLPAVREAHKRRLAALLPQTRKTLAQLLKDENSFVKLGAVKEVHKQVLENEAGQKAGGGGVQVNIGFLGASAPPTVTVVKKDDE